MATPTPMPARGDRNAPQFDSAKPHELRRYFTDLEFLLDRATVTDNTERKKHATRFLSVEDQETWEALPSFSDATKSYTDFKAAALKLYAGNDEERRFSLSDLDALIGQYARTGILSKEDLTSFYRRFLRITTYLVNKGRLSPAEQSRAFLRAMQPASLSLEIRQRLQIKKPDIHPEDPYALTDLLEAAEFVIAGGGTTAALVASSASSSTALPASVEVKPDPGIAALVGSVAELIKVLATQNSSNASVTNSTAPRKPRPDGCGYCSDPEHYINQCPLVLEDIKAGKCRRNSDNRVVLPSGAFVPRLIQGRDLRARIEEWHRQNPGQLATAQLLVGVTVDHFSSPSPSNTTARTFNLSTEDRIQTLELEINALRTRAQAKRALEAQDDRDEPERTIPRAAAQPARAPAPKPAPAPAAAPPTAAAIAPLPAPAPAPQHPFSGARDAAYAPPKERNVGLPPQKAHAPAYRTNAPIFNEKDATDVFDASLDSKITITQRQLLSIAPDVRAHMREATTARRVPPKENKTANDSVQQLIHEIDGQLPYIAEINTIEEQRAQDARHAALVDSLPASYSQFTPAQSNLPADAFVVPDPYAVFYDAGVVPDDLVVSMESSAIRSILPIIDNRAQVECIIDGGSQINAMSEAVCHELALSYDPRVVLRMQSANGAISPSLGLARNVPFRIGDITLYLQVHIVRNPAYDVLLGRPFDVLTQSVIRNFANEDQTITICDPNSGKLATVPTVPRGPPRNRSQGFPNSRI
ncbi:hypothetical protein MVEN_02177000 [Mycena venus]|uniref:Peptidase A2 domain-containing protein n=1 Tax=Mycena venus TaxID=2733690 RepID=A0A8H6X8B3_9AGAR|nr:hypothetical protein MVEN_02177000 [Mycena venus]